MNKHRTQTLPSTAHVAWIVAAIIASAIIGFLSGCEETAKASPAPASDLSISNAIPTDAYNHPPLDIMVPQSKSTFAWVNADGRLVVKTITRKAHKLLIAEPAAKQEVPAGAILASLAATLPEPLPPSETAASAPAKKIILPPKGFTNLCSTKIFCQWGTNMPHRTNFMVQVQTNGGAGTAWHAVTNLPADGENREIRFYATNALNLCLRTRNITLP